MDKQERFTSWRQGQVLSNESAEALGLMDSQSPKNTVVVLVTHDCNLTNSKRLYAEVIIGKDIENSDVDGVFTHAKSPHTLHLDFICEGKPITVELFADKHKILKKDLESHKPASSFQLEPKDRNILQRWLAADYKRAAFPNEFNNRLKQSDLDKKIRNIIRKAGKFVPAIYFDLDSGEDIERQGSNDLYVLTIYIIYITDDYEKANLAVQQAKLEIEKAFNKKLKSENGDWQSIELRDCYLVTEDAWTYRHWKSLSEWKLEDISLKEDPTQATID